MFLPRLSGERKFFTAASSMQWKKIFSAASKMRWKQIFAAISRVRWKKFTAKIANLIANIYRAVFNAYLKFTGSIIEVSGRWRSGIRSCWHAGGGRFEPVYDSFFFVRNPLKVVKKIFTAKIRKNSPHSTLKAVGAGEKWFAIDNERSDVENYDSVNIKINGKGTSYLWKFGSGVTFILEDVAHSVQERTDETV